MVVREWRARASASKVAAYPTHFRSIVVPELLHVPGFLAAQLSQRRIDGQIEFVVLTRWHSMEAIQAFAGVDVDQAVVEPGAIAVLVDFDLKARHYEIIEEISAH